MLPYSTLDLLACNQYSLGCHCSSAARVFDHRLAKRLIIGELILGMVQLTFLYAMIKGNYWIEIIIVRLLEFLIFRTTTFE